MNAAILRFRLLRRLLIYHEQPPTLAALVLQLAKRLAGWALALTLVVLACPSEQRTWVLMFCAGVLVGFLNSGAASIRLLLSSWPIYETIIDWSKAKELAQQAAQPPTQTKGK